MPSQNAERLDYFRRSGRVGRVLVPRPRRVSALLGLRPSALAERTIRSLVASGTALQGLRLFAVLELGRPIQQQESAESPQGVDAIRAFIRRHSLPRERRFERLIPLLARERLGLPTAEAAIVHRLTPGEPHIEAPLQ